jgi:hypothetical protein
LTGFVACLTFVQTIKLNKKMTTETEKRRETITFQLTPSEKRELTTIAIQECGISVSEFIRTRIFAPVVKEKESTETIESQFSDEERLIYEEKIKEQKALIKSLTDELTSVKISKATVKESTDFEIPETIEESVLKINLLPEFKNVIDRIKEYRVEKEKSFVGSRLQATFYDNNKFFTLMLLRGFKRSFYSSDLGSNTGLKLSELDPTIKEAEINEFNV